MGEKAHGGRQWSSEVVHRQVELEHAGEGAQSGRDGAVEGVSGDDEALECGEVADGGGKQAAVACAGLQTDSGNARDAEDRRAAVDAAGEVGAEEGVARVKCVVPGAHACRHHNGGCVKCLLHLRSQP